MVIDGSFPKNGFPLTKILLTSLPLTLILPSASISTPGNCFSKSSTVASFLVLKELTLNSKVSFFIVTGAEDVITTSSNALLICKLMAPKLIVPEVIAIFFL